MKSRMRWFLSTTIVIALCAFSAVTFNQPEVHAQEAGVSFRGAPHCTNVTASGTYGYRMAGQLVGVGPFLVNGIFTHYPDGTMDGDVHLTLGNQQIPAKWSGGTFKTNSDCTGSGKFFIQALNLEVTYNFISTDGGQQIELLNTDQGVVLHGAGRRIGLLGFAPRCRKSTILGAYGYRLDGSLPNVPFAAFAGKVTHSLGDDGVGVIKGSDTASFMGQYTSRTLEGTFNIGSNCRGTGFYTDSLGNHINYVFTAVDGGETLYLLGSDPGVAVSGVARRVN
ncbi:MAG: hypothetical protein MOB07_03955 [Acidobacteria bacterium]|nr:hypothetical protein [Acidobacteriota bacterium]